MVGLVGTSKRTYDKGPLPGLLLPVSLCPRWATAHWCLHRRPSSTSRYVWFSLLWGHCSTPLGLGACKILLCLPRVESLFPLVLWKSCNQILLAFKVRFPGDLPSLCCPQAEKPDVGLRMFTAVRELLWYYCSLVCGLPTQQIWDFILSWLCPS